MNAEQAHDAMIALQKSQISPKFHKRFLERIDFKSGTPIDDQVKLLESEFLEITGIAPKGGRNPGSKLDQDMKEFLEEKFPEEEKQESE